MEFSCRFAIEVVEWNDFHEVEWQVGGIIFYSVFGYDDGR